MSRILVSLLILATIMMFGCAVSSDDGEGEVSIDEVVAVAEGDEDLTLGEPTINQPELVTGAIFDPVKPLEPNQPKKQAGP